MMYIILVLLGYVISAFGKISDYYYYYSLFTINAFQGLDLHSTNSRNKHKNYVY